LAGRQSRARRALLRRRARQDVSVRPRRLPGDVRVGAGAQRIGARRGAHLRGKDRRGRVRHRDGVQGQSEGGVHLAAQGAVQPEVQGAHRGVRRRRVDDGRRVHKPKRVVHRDDHRGAEGHALPRQRRRAGGEVDHLRRGALHARQGARGGVGGEHNLRPRRVQVRLPLGDATKRARVRRVDHPPAQPPVPRRLHRLPPHAAAALRVPQGGQRHGHDRQRAERVYGGELRRARGEDRRADAIGEEEEEGRTGQGGRRTRARWT